MTFPLHLHDLSLFRRASAAYRRLPRPIRRHTDSLVAGTVLSIEHMLHPGPSPEGSGITVVGLFSSPSGIGEAARLGADALEGAGATVERVDLAPMLGLSAPALRIAPAAPLAEGPVIVHLNPPQCLRALCLIGRHRLSHRPLLAYWAWELERAPAAWARAARRFDEIWTPSIFSAAAVDSLGAKVRVVPHPVVPRPALPDRVRFGLPPEGFVALTFVNLHSNLERKNPDAALRAFAAAFPVRRPDVALALKLDGSEIAPDRARALRARAAALPCAVFIITETLDPMGRDSLIASSDVLLSLHRSEGFGLTLAEAMALGRPVIATAWSGNLDLACPGLALWVMARLVPVNDPQGFYDPTLRWAEADTGMAARLLRRVHAVRAVFHGENRPAPLDLGEAFLAAVRASVVAPFLPGGLATRPEHQPQR